MKLQLYIILLLLSVGCKQQGAHSDAEKVPINKEEGFKTPKHTPQKKNKRITSLSDLSLNKADQDYASVKQAIEKERIELPSKDIKQDSLSKLFERALLHKIIPFWEGTEWSFEGHTSTPQSGKIACGYFVSTTLQDIGIRVNRYKLAQQSPINEARSLALNKAVKVFSEASISQNIASINAYLKEGIHFIGFDQNHVGYILKKNGDLYLIHSNYINATGVEIEPIEQSAVFNSYNTFYIVELSTNEDLLKNWMNGKRI